VPSEWYEGGLPLVALRSLAVGTPVVVSDLDNICEDIVRGQAGWTFPVGDPAGLAKTLSMLHGDPALARERRSVARRAYVDTYSPDANLRRLEDVYSGVIDGVPAR
jgi:glycosyltransferase involved in cell wall biosynthesis